MMEIREAEWSERRDIKTLVRRSELNPVGIDWRRFLVAIDDVGEIVGIGQIKIHRSARELASIAVVPSWQGKGVARGIIERLLRDSLRELWLTCRSQLIPFYLLFGFAEVRERREVPFYFRVILRVSSIIRLLRPNVSFLLISRIYSSIFQIIC